MKRMLRPGKRGSGTGLRQGEAGEDARVTVGVFFELLVEFLGASVPTCTFGSRDVKAAAIVGVDPVDQLEKGFRACVKRGPSRL